MPVLNQDNPRVANPYGLPIFDSRFIKFVFRISGGIKFWDASWGLRHWRYKLNYSYDGLLICFSILILWTLCRKPMKERQKALCLFIIFVVWPCFNRWWVKGCGVEQKVLFRAFPVEILAEAIRTTHSGMLYRLDICFIFMSHCFFRFPFHGSL